MRHTLIITFVLMTLLTVSAQASLTEDIEADAEILAEQVKEFTQGKEVVVVLGTHMSKTERLALIALQKKYPQFNELEVIKESDLTPERTELEGKTAFIIGGPTQNKIAKQALASGSPDETKISIGKVSFLTAPDGNAYIIVSDKAGYSNIPKLGPAKSPLAKIMPVEYVPATAAAIGFSLLWLWQFFYPILKRIARLSLSSQVLKKIKRKEFNPKYKGIKIAGVRFKIREWLSIAGAASMFALAVAWSYLAGEEGFLILLLVNVFVNLMVYTIRHFTRLYMDRVHEIHTEYVFWAWGAALTVLTGWLGTTFSLSGYTVSDENKKSKKEGKILYAIDFFTFTASVVFLIWNFISPHMILQMAMVLSMSIAFFQMFPFEPFAGKKIYAWRKGRWWLTFIPMAIIYTFVNLVL